MKRLLKKTEFSVSTILALTLNKKVFALQNIKDSGENFISKGSASTIISTDEAWNILLPIAQILVGIASVVLVITYMYLGIQYMMADPQGKANVKQKLIGLVIATVVIYGGVGIFTIIINLFNSIFA